MKGGINLEGVSFLKVVQKEADSAGDGELAGGPTGVQSAWSPSALLPRKVGEGSAKRHPCWVQALCICSVGSLLRDENNQDPVLSRLNPQRDVPGREQSDSFASLGLGSSLRFWKLFPLHKEAQDRGALESVHQRCARQAEVPRDRNFSFLHSLVQ